MWWRWRSSLNLTTAGSLSHLTYRSVMCRGENGTRRTLGPLNVGGRSVPAGVARAFTCATAAAVRGSRTGSLISSPSSSRAPAPPRALAALSPTRRAVIRSIAEACTLARTRVAPSAGLAVSQRSSASTEVTRVMPNSSNGRQ